MAKKADEPCLFCGGLPCVCDGGPKKKSSPLTRKVASPKKRLEAGVDSAPSANATEASTEDVFGATPERVKPKFKSSAASETRDLSYESALSNLLAADILSEHDARLVKQDLRRSYPQDVDRRVEQWKKRSDGQQ